jgi:DNA-binding NtrC family response regulator
MTGRRILVISQDRWLLDRLRDLLDSAGFEAEIALSGAVGATIAVERRVDLLLADEAVDDFHNVRKIKDPASSTYRLPAIVIKANGGVPKQDVGRLFPSAVLNRNFENKDLITNIKNALSHRDGLSVKNCA